MSFSCVCIFRSTLAKSHLIQIGKYSRWSHRRPARTLLPFEDKQTSLKRDQVIDLTAVKNKDSKQVKMDMKNSPKKPQLCAVGSQETDKKDKLSADNKSNLQKTDKPLTMVNAADEQFTVVPSNIETSAQVINNSVKKISKQTVNKQNIKQLTVFDENNDIIFEKCKDMDGRISSLLVKLKSKKDRLNKGQVLVEGWRLIVDGLEAKCKLRYLIFSHKKDLDNLRAFLPKSGVKIYKIPYKEIEMWSSVETSPGIIGIFDVPSNENIKRFYRPFPMQIICDNIRVPGNLGAILRTAIGAGCERVLLTKGCVDLWDPKVIRSAAGAHFRIPVHQSLDWEEVAKLVAEKSSVLVADSNTDDNDDIVALESNSFCQQLPVIPYYGVEYPKMEYVTVIVGGETEGISEDSYRFAAERNGLRINIPLQNGVDSLNTGMATAVILFEIKKQLLQAYTKAKQDKEKMYVT